MIEITHTTFHLGDLTWTLAPHPESDSFLQLRGMNAENELVALAQIAASTNGLASIDLRATTGNPLTVTVGDASGGLVYQGTA